MEANCTEYHLVYGRIKDVINEVNRLLNSDLDDATEWAVFQAPVVVFNPVVEEMLVVQVMVK